MFHKSMHAESIDHGISVDKQITYTDDNKWVGTRYTIENNNSVMTLSPIQIHTLVQFVEALDAELKE